MAVIFERYAKATGYNIPASREASTYADKENIGSEYRSAVTAMQQSGIMMGIDGNKFNPKGTTTRAEVSAMLSRYIKLTILYNVPGRTSVNITSQTTLRLAKEFPNIVAIKEASSNFHQIGREIGRAHV